MIRLNDNFLKLQTSYLFSDIKKRVAAFQEAHPEKEIIPLGIGDVTRTLPPACIKALHAAADEMADEATFRGYGPEQGYPFLREKIAQVDFQARGADISPDEVFVSDGTKCDTGNILDILGADIRIAIPDPVYPVYLDTSVMAGHTGNFENGRFAGIFYLEGTPENGFVPNLPDETVDLIYLCFPNNPTGAMISRSRLKEWVDYARAHKALILYDAAYEAFIRDPQVPRSIFEIEGAREVAIEFRSFSKSGGFTGMRCAYTIIPKTCRAYTAQGEAQPLHPLWLRRQSTKFNSVAYPIQRAAAALYTPEGQDQAKERIDYYLQNAAIIRNEMEALGYACIGGENSPYIWVDGRRDSWSFFDLLLKEAGVACTPGAGFGRCGEGYIRISAFNSRNNVQKAMERIKTALS